MTARPRLALVTPWPPEPSGIADYAELISKPLAARIDVDIITAGAPGEYAAPTAAGVRLISAAEPGLVESLSGYDRVVYAMGNSRFHLHALALLRRHPGVVHFHDVQLTGLYSCLAAQQFPDRWEAATIDSIEAMYPGGLPAGALAGGLPDWGRLAALGVFMSREISGLAEQSFVHSQRALAMLDSDSAGPAHARGAVLPFGMPEVAGDAEPRARVNEAPLVVHLGVVNPIKGIETLISAFGLVAKRHPAARLVIGGAIEESDASAWEEYAREQAPQGPIEIAGRLDRDRYAALVRDADVAVQLRTIDTGEASGAIADCLAAGVPTIVSDLGWAGELPRSAVVHVAVDAPPERVAERIDELLVDPATRTALSVAALEHARAHSFERVATDYLEAIGIRT